MTILSHLSRKMTNCQLLSGSSSQNVQICFFYVVYLYKFNVFVLDCWWDKKLKWKQNTISGLEG